MKYGLLCVLFIAINFVATCQDTSDVAFGTITISKNKYANAMPSVAKKTGGKIMLRELLESNGIEVEKFNLSVISFKLTFEDGLDKFEGKGNRISGVMLERLFQEKNGSTFFFEDIVAVDENNEKVMLPSLVFILKRLPRPTICGMSGGELVNPDTLCGQEIELLTTDSTYTITSFSVSTNSEGAWTRSSSGRNQLTEKMKSEISTTYYGSLIYFENIVAKDEDGKYVELERMVFEVF